MRKLRARERVRSSFWVGNGNYCATLLRSPSITLPVIAYLWWSGDAVTRNVVCSVCLFLAGTDDNVLKPLSLGRGVDAPVPVILIGALGGIVVSGILGLFIGAVLMAVGYQIFMDWLAEDPVQDSPLPGAVSAGTMLPTLR
jgi:predicted PurR-regulated permease PerM